MPPSLEPGKPYWRRMPTGVAGAVFWLALWFGLVWLVRLSPAGQSPLFAGMQILVGLALIALAVPLAWKLIRKHLLWSLRSKLILTYLLIGLAPVVLFVTLVGISAYIAAGQFSIHLAETRLNQELNDISADNAVRTSRLARLVRARGQGALAEGPPGPRRDLQPQPPNQAAPEPILDPLHERLRRHTTVFINGAPQLTGPGLQPPQPTPANEPTRTPLGLPPWASDLPRKEFNGIVIDGDDLYLVAMNQRRIEGGEMLTVITSLPVDTALMDVVAQGLGRCRLVPVTTATARLPNANARSSQRGDHLQRAPVNGGTEPVPVNFADIRVPFVSTLDVTDWDTGELDNAPIEVNSRPSLLYAKLFGSSLSGIITSYIRYGLVGISIVFAIIEAFALWFALRLSRAITASVTGLYEATQRVDLGDFTYRIPAATPDAQPDQLDELASSFNTMTSSLGRLIVEQKEKERLQNELSIAQEVQANLFPHHAHDLPTLQLHGVCRPARSVSGDYYDFLIFHRATDGNHAGPESGVGIALGDISGKGISAALLMATLHSAVRAYRFASEDLVFSDNSVAGLRAGLTASREGLAGDGGKLFESPGRILSLLNRHLYRSTQPEKYATLFLAHYDADTAYLTYSNAGQLPPLVLSRDGKIRRLDKGGTVVGLMDGMRYEEGRFQMQSGDIMVAYSDGVTEPENDFGDFGEDRLMEVVARYRDQPLHVISAQVMLALDAWIGAEEQPDDITLVLARQI